MEKCILYIESDLLSRAKKHLSKAEQIASFQNHLISYISDLNFGEEKKLQIRSKKYYLLNAFIIGLEKSNNVKKCHKIQITVH